MKLYYTDHFELPLPEEHRFPMDKYRRLRRHVAASEIHGSDAVGRDAGELAGIGSLGVAVIDDAAAMFDGVDAVIEFSAPEATAVAGGEDQRVGPGHAGQVTVAGVVSAATLVAL